MTTQTIQFETVSPSEIGSGTITAFLFSGATLTATLSSISENATLKGRHTGTVADIAAGTYRLVIKFDGYTISDPEEVVTLLTTVGTYVASRPAELDSAARVKLDATQPDYAPALAADINAELLDVLDVDTFPELSSVPPSETTLRSMIQWLFMWARNKSTQSATQRKLFADNESTVVSTESVGDSAGVFTKGEAS